MNSALWTQKGARFLDKKINEEGKKKKKIIEARWRKVRGNPLSTVHIYNITVCTRRLVENPSQISANQRSKQFRAVVFTKNLNAWKPSGVFPSTHTSGKLCRNISSVVSWEHRIRKPEH